MKNGVSWYSRENCCRTLYTLENAPNAAPLEPELCLLSSRERLILKVSYHLLQLCFY